MRISIDIEVNAPLREVWHAWVTSDDIVNWNFASEDWCCSSAVLDLDVGGKFKYRMETKDGSIGFDFRGEFTKIIPQKTLCFTLEDSREVEVEFSESGGGTRVVETFDSEDDSSVAQQRQGWLSILNSFKKHVEAKTPYNTSH